jgi:hypothetical protein
MKRRLGFPQSKIYVRLSSAIFQISYLLIGIGGRFPSQGRNKSKCKKDKYKELDCEFKWKKCIK